MKKFVWSHVHVATKEFDEFERSFYAYLQSLSKERDLTAHLVVSIHHNMRKNEKRANEILASLLAVKLP